MTPFSFSVILYEHGTLSAGLSVGEEPVTIFASYLSDALGDLTGSAVALLAPSLLDRVTCSWQDEPGETRWILRRVEDRVQVQLLRFEQTFSRLPDERGQSIFEAECSLLRFAAQVKGQLHQLHNEYGEEGYRNRWRHPFPMAAFQRLQTRVNDLKKALASEQE
jgi:hypothetical protein